MNGWLRRPEFLVGFCTMCLGLMFFSASDSKLVGLLNNLGSAPRLSAFVIFCVGIAMMVTMVWEVPRTRLVVMFIGFCGWLIFTVLQIRAEFNIAVTWFSPPFTAVCALGIYDALNACKCAIRRERRPGREPAIEAWGRGGL